MGRLYPSCDLHFYPGAAGARMRVFERFGAWSDLATFPNFTMQLIPIQPAAPAPAIATLTGTRIDPGVEGVQLAALRISSPGLQPQTWDIAIRATVHHALHALLLPVTALTLETDRSDRVLTVYGQFADAAGGLSTFDITRHDYLQYAIAPLTGAPDAVASVVGGRITTGAAPGTALVTVSTAGGPSVSLVVTVAAAPTDRPILSRTFTGSSLRKRSLLLISEGFGAAERARFETMSRDLTAQLLQHVPPYDLLRESFDVFSAFVPSPERGATLGPPVVPVASPNSTLTLPVGAELPLVSPGAQHKDFALDDLVNRLRAPTSHNPALTFAQAAVAMGTADNHALSQVTFNTWQLLANLPPQTRVRETAFGFILGERHYSTAVTLRPAAAANLDIAFELLASQGATRTPWFDDRRLPDLVAGSDPGAAHVALQDRFVRTLRPAGGVPGFGAVWATGGDSYGLVIYLVNHDYFGGLAQQGYVGMSVGADIVLSVVPSTAVTGLFDVEPVPVPLSAAAVRQGFKQRPIWSLADVLAHELGHTVPLGGLNDEYASGNGPPTSAPAIAFVEKSANTQVLANAVATGGGHPGVAIDPDRLKWNWERAEAAAEIDDLTGSGAQVAIVLNAENWTRWPKGSVGRSVLLRQRGTLEAGVPKSELLVIQSLDPATQTIHVATPATSAEALITLFSARGVVVMPVVDAARAARHLVDPLVIGALATGPFSPSPGCVPNPHPAPPAIPGLPRLHDHNRLVAAFESGAGFDCGVIRPSADCKMRTAGDASAQFVPVDFCFACKYVITEAVDPGSHGELDRTSYPK
jgi:hypothetical protein